jgi:hypothetical protein
MRGSFVKTCNVMQLDSARDRQNDATSVSWYPRDIGGTLDVIAPITIIGYGKLGCVISLDDVFCVVAW